MNGKMINLKELGKIGSQISAYLSSMFKKLPYNLKQIANKLWFKPIIFCSLSIVAALLAHLADDSFIVDLAPEIERSSLEDLLKTLSNSMLVIAIFAVGSMLSAFSAASGTATPRSFRLVVADDVSQNALSVFIGSFIFSIVGLTALKNNYYGPAGFFVLYIITIMVFAVVIGTFLRWVERISKLGRLAHTIMNVEEATATALKFRLKEPFLGGVAVTGEKGAPVFGEQLGYVQHINMEALQELAETLNVRFVLHAMPGTFVTSNMPLFYILSEVEKVEDFEAEKLNKIFIIQPERNFDEDPRFGLIALSEISSRALSPAVNDPGTAIAIIGSHVRLFTLWLAPKNQDTVLEVKYPRLQVPVIALEDIFTDAFRPIARDGANNIEVMIRFQKALQSIAYKAGDNVIRIAGEHAEDAFERAKLALPYAKDVEGLVKVCTFQQN